MTANIKAPGNLTVSGYVTSVPYSVAGNPTVNNDSVDTAALGRAFHKGDVWINTSTNTVYTCAADTPTAASWSSGGGVDPTFATTTEFHVYANGTTGNDGNTGLVVGSPKLTLGAVFALIPFYCRNNVVVHLAGTFTDWGVVGLSRILNSGILLIIDGGTGTTEIVASTLSDINSVLTIGKAAAGWTIDAYKGYLVEILDGDAVGDIRTIQGNSGTTITPTKKFSADPGAGAHFRITRPTTMLTASGVVSSLVVANGGNAGTVVVQNLYFAGSKAQLKVSQSIGAVIISSVVSASTYSADAAILVYSSADVRFLDSNTYNVTTFALISSAGGNGAGVSLLGAPGAAYYFYCDTDGYIEISGCFFVGTYIYRVQNAIVHNGFRTNTMDMQQVVGSNINKLPSADYAPVVIDKSPGAGLIVSVNTFCLLGDNVVVSNNGANGITVQFGGILNLVGVSIVLTGTNNTGYGGFAGLLGNIILTAGSTPTLTGTTNNVAVPTAANTWANVAAGTILLDANSKALVRQ
jgi:hypothetical protein